MKLPWSFAIVQTLEGVCIIDHVSLTHSSYTLILLELSGLCNHMNYIYDKCSKYVEVKELLKIIMLCLIGVLFCDSW